LEYFCHSYDAVVVITFVVVKFVRVGVYKWQCSSLSCNTKWLKVGIATHSIFGVTLGDELLLNQ
jgi:hypothetical protein